MAARKTIQQKEVEALTKNSLLELGRLIKVVTARNSKVSKLQKDHLRDSIGRAVKPFNVLILSQKFYGQFNTPKGQQTPKNRTNLTDTPMENAIQEYLPDATNVYIKNMIDLLISPIV
jgi:hypothetical protein